MYSANRYSLSENTQIVIASVVCGLVLAFVLLIVIAGRFVDELRRIARTRVTRIGDLSERSLAKVVGCVVTGDEELVSPVSGLRCVHYETVVTDGIVQIVEERGVDFVVRDATGAVPL